MIPIGSEKNFFVELLGYLKRNVPYIIKGFIGAVLVAAGPLIAMLVREGGSNWSIIMAVGFIFTAFGIAAFWFFIRSYYKIEEFIEEEVPPLKKKKRKVPKSVANKEKKGT